MFLLTTPIVKNSQIWLEFTLSFEINALDEE